MSQSDFGTINAATKSGTQLAVDLNNWRDAVHSTHSGNARPSYVQAGMIWIDTTSSTLWLIKLYDGADDIVLFQIDTTNNIARIRSRRQEVVKTADYTLTSDDSYVAIIMNKTGTGTLSLPALSGTASELYFTENISSSALTVDPNSTETINGQTTLSLAQYGCAYIWPAGDKSTWRCMTSADVAAAIHAATGKTTIVDNDEFGLADSAASYALKKVLFSNLITSIFTTSRKIPNAYFDTSFRLWDSAALTKGLQFDISAVTAGQTRKIIMPDRDVNIDPAWEVIQELNTGLVSSIDITNLAAYDKIWIKGTIYTSGAGTPYCVVSIDNGASFITTASYDSQYVVGNSATLGTAKNTGQAAMFLAGSSGLSTSSSRPSLIDFTITNLNKTTYCQFQSQISDMASSYLKMTNGDFNGSTARNAIRLIMSTGTISVKATVMGRKG